MPYIGNPIYQSAFVTDQFSGDGTTTAFTMSVAPAGTTNVLVVVSGVVQDPSTYGVVGTTLNFSAAPPSGTGNISCRYLGVPVTGVTTTAYRTVTEFTATASQTTFTPPSYNVGFINVYLNGVLLGSADYTATNGTTVVLATGASAGNILTVESFQISSVANAISNTAGSVSSTNLATNSVTTTKIADGSVTPAKLSTGAPTWTSSGQLLATNSSGSTIIANRTANPGSIEIQYDGTQTAQFSALSGGGLSIYTGSTPTERMRLNTSGTVILQGGSTSATGIGITFPATQSASTDANTLDDYEEGSWTPTINPTSGTVTVGTNGMRYTKIGNMVSISGYLSISSVSSPSGLTSIGGFPFTPFSYPGNGSNVSYTMYNTNGNLPANGVFWAYTTVSANGAYIRITSGNGITELGNFFQAGTEFWINATYQAA